LTSRITRWNSVDTGGSVSRTTISTACRNEEPARSALAMSVIVSARRELNARRRPPCRRRSQKRGTKKPTMAPMIRPSGPARAGRKSPPTTATRTGIAIIAAAQT
jgi:hypothetical protein